MCSHSIKSVLIYSLVIYEYFLKEKINLLGKKSISDIVSDDTVEVLGVAPAMFEKEMGRGRGLNRKSHPIQSSRKKTRRFFRNPLISLKSSVKTETKTQAETETRKHAQDPLHNCDINIVNVVKFVHVHVCITCITLTSFAAIMCESVL